jgi:hypothetical protein
MYVCFLRICVLSAQRQARQAEQWKTGFGELMGGGGGGASEML